MNVSSVSGASSAQQNDQVTNKAQSSSPQQAQMPQDTVNISSAAKALQTSNASTDVDHDGDSK